MKKLWKIGLCLVALSLSLSCWVLGSEYTVEQVTAATLPSTVKDMEGFSDGLAIFYNSEHGVRTFGYVDGTGAVVIPAIYDTARDFDLGFAVVGLYDDNEGRTLLGLIDQAGNQVIPCEWRSITVFRPEIDYADGTTEEVDHILGVLCFDADRNETCLYFQAYGDSLVPEGYTGVRRGYGGAYGDNMLVIQAADGTYTYYDIENDVVLPCAFDGAFPFREGLAHAGYIHSTLGCIKYGFIDKTGEMVIEDNYYGANSFENGQTIVSVSASNGYQLIDTQANVLLDFEWKFPDYGVVSSEYGDGMFELTDYVDGVWYRGACDSGGNLVIPLFTGSLGTFFEGSAVKRVDGLSTLIDTTGRMISVGSYDSISSGSTSYLEVTLGDYEGVIDRQGYEIIPPTTYVWVDIDQAGYAKVTYPVTFDSTIIDLSTGEAIIPDYNQCYFPSDGLIRVRNDDYQYGYVDLEGNLIIPCVFDTAFDFVDGFATVEQEDGTWLILANPLASATTTTTTTVVATPTASPTTSTVLVDGTNTPFEAYNIADNNYFKLRDVAQILSGTQAQFEVTWDGDKQAINLVSGQGYTSVGGELATGNGTAKEYLANTSTIYLDGVAVNLTAYTINDNNYFKLRDLGEALGFNVSWDSSAQTIVIASDEAYTAD